MHCRAALCFLLATLLWIAARPAIAAESWSIKPFKVAHGGAADSTGRGPLGSYAVIPDARQQISLGYTGPLRGAVFRETGGATTRMINSGLCGNLDEPIGEVLHADERKLEVHIQTQMCSVPIGVAEPIIQQEEFLDARFTLPLDWRDFTSSLPQDALSPGIQSHGEAAGATRGGTYPKIDLGELDEETRRYQVEVSQLDVPENVWQSWVTAFSHSGPDIRSRMWEDLDRYRAQHDPAEIAAQQAEIEQELAEREERASHYDGETRRYRDALRAAGYSEDEVKGLTEIFAASSASMRQIFWDSIGS